MIDVRLLPKQPSINRLLQSASALPNAILFDGDAESHPNARFSILSAWPEERYLCLQGQKGYEIRLNGETTAYNSAKDAIQAFRQHLTQRMCHFQVEASTLELDIPLPFIGGLCGAMSYDFGLLLEGVVNQQPRTLDTPLADIGLYGWAIVVNHSNEDRYLVLNESIVSARTKTLIDDWLTELSVASLKQADDTHKAPFSLSKPFHQDIPFEGYASAFEAIKAYILAGDCYQTNLTQRFSAPFTGKLSTVYSVMRQAAQSPFGGFYQGHNFQLLSVSPERFIECQGDQVETKPIKGTAPRSADPTEDQLTATLLATSEKNRAENLMIVDLLRNDLSRSCIPGSVQVPDLCKIEHFPNVHHLVSTIRGTLQTNKTPLDVLFDAFPGGSITGAPKRRSMEIIEELEPHNRSFYCGSLFYNSVHGHLDSNILIRSFIAYQGQLLCWGGGGIVQDSELDDEYAESLTKVQRWMNLMEEQSERLQQCEAFV